jgi:hypothetical protein
MYLGMVEYERRVERIQRYTKGFLKFQEPTSVGRSLLGAVRVVIY